MFAYVVLFENRFWFSIPPFFQPILRAATEVVGFAVLPDRAKEDREVVSSVFLRPLRLSPVQHLCCVEDFQFLVVCDDLNLVFGSFQIPPPSLEAVDDSE